MALSAKDRVIKTLAKFDIGVIRNCRLNELWRHDPLGRDMELLLQMEPDRGAEAFKLLRCSKSQLRQDIFALSEVNFKRGGFFVEFGATDGTCLSNTYLLEKEFGWRGILAEPARRWHDALKHARSCSIETDCVWRETGSKLRFKETDDGAFSTIDTFSNSDINSKNRKFGSSYDVSTISLNDLLDKYDAPKRIDYLSVDTEGSEFDILSHFDFNKRQFGVITVEHNYGPEREMIYSLLTGNGYMRKFETSSLWDDWYVLAS